MQKASKGSSFGRMNISEAKSFLFPRLKMHSEDRHLLTPLLQRIFKMVEPIALKIDASLQFEVEQHLANTVRRTNSRSGIVIVMNASTGEILALANEPTFSPNEKSGPRRERRNRALTDGYEPGSTLKAVLAASALSNGGKLTDQVFGEMVCLNSAH